jgi:flagellar hook-associated protein 3 FlgL
MPVTRVTQNIIFNSATTLLQRQQQRLLDAQQIVSTQRRINALSDDPVGAGRVFRLQGQQSETEQFLRNIDRATTLSSAYDTALAQANDILTRARELVVGQANTATSSAQTREAAAIELIALREQLLNIANTRVGNQYIFAGHRDSVAPFAGATPSAAAGGGNTGTGSVSSISVSNITDVTGDAYQIVFTSPNTFDIVNTTKSSTVSTGNTYTPDEPITIDGLTLAITGAPAAGDTFDITVTPGGAYSGDSGLKRLEIEQDVLATVNLTGDAVFQGAGVTGGVDIFDVFNDVIDALRNGDDATVVGTLDRLDQAQDQVVGQQAIIGARENLLDTTSSRLGDLNVNIQALISSVQDVDVTEAITNFTEVENAYQASLGAAGRMIQPSLLDFLG